MNNKLKYHDERFSGYGVQFSPFQDNRLATASGSNFGLVGNGKLTILDIDNLGQISSVNSYLTQDCLFDLTWNELNSNQILVAQGDGTLRLFDSKLNKYPIAIFKEHEREAVSCEWDLVSKTHFVSSSWDASVKLWAPQRPSSISTLKPASGGNESLYIENALPKYRVPQSTRDYLNCEVTQRNRQVLYQVHFSPANSNIVMCCSADSYVTVFDVREPQGAQQRFRAHSGFETLCCDFNKYRPETIVTGGVNNSLRIWDMRFIQKFNGMSRNIACINEISNAHDLAIRKAIWSPHHSNILLSSSYDMSCKVWRDVSYNGQNDTGKTNNSATGKGSIKAFRMHTEFVFGADWSLWGKPGYVATSGWDGNTYIWNALH